MLVLSSTLLVAMRALPLQAWTLPDESNTDNNKQNAGLQQSITRWTIALPYCLKALLSHNCAHTHIALEHW